MNRKRIILLFVLLVFLLVKVNFIDVLKVNGNSMIPNLYDKELLLLNKFDKNYNRFDIVVLRKNGVIYVKRIIGLPSEVVKYKENQLFINDVLLTEDFEHGYADDVEFLTGKEDEIPKQSYIVLGDNRTDSIDSRNFGIVRKEEIIGKIITTIFNIH